MRIIHYKESGTTTFKKYVDIGACEKHSNFLPLLDKESISYEDWFSGFVKLPLGMQMLTLHFYLLCYNSKLHIPIIIKTKLTRNKKLFNDFNRQWFEPEQPFFKALDLNWEDIEDQITASKEDNNGIRTEVKFDNGSVLRFLDKNDHISSFYVLQEDFVNLKNAFAEILEKLK